MINKDIIIVTILTRCTFTGAPYKAAYAQATGIAHAIHTVLTNWTMPDPIHSEQNVCSMSIAQSTHSLQDGY